MVMQIVAWIASFFVFCSFFMKTMIPLRIVAIISNFTFITYALLGLKFGIFEKVYPIFVLHVMLLPLNIVRLYQMKNLVKKVHDASSDSSDSSEVDYLIPYMDKHSYYKNHVLFKKDDEADKIFFIELGSILLPEINKVLQKGSVLGEVGIFSAENTRATSGICNANCIIHEIHRDKVLELYYQNPKFGFFLMRTVTRIVKDNVEEMMPSRKRL